MSKNSGCSFQARFSVKCVDPPKFFDDFLCVDFFAICPLEVLFLKTLRSLPSEIWSADSEVGGGLMSSEINDKVWVQRLKEVFLA
mmetsp:Transcript_81326/g.140812  ORF Transcript_81326/g.140812 Transcript_81326/m.140812 type:complete len:85 (-) Transcript_81326:298-552(-)